MSDAAGLRSSSRFMARRPTSETYLGHGQSTGFQSGGDAKSDDAHDYVAAFSGLSTNEWGLAGNWTFASRVDPQPAGWPDRLPVPGARREPRDGTGDRPHQNTYPLIRQSGPVVDRLFEIEFLESGVEGYGFTFG